MTSETDKELLLRVAANCADEARSRREFGGVSAMLLRGLSSSELDTIARVLREAAEGWRPIETAPHGEIVLMAWKDSFLPQWSFEVGFASHGTRYPTGYSSVSQHGQATHWRPLPSPPSETGNG